MKVRLGALCWVGAAVGYFVAEGIAAGAMPAYHYAADYISLLGQPDRSPHAGLMNAAFVVQGVLFPAGAMLTAGRSRRALALMACALCNGVGNLVVAVVHSGAGAGWHQVGATLAIAGGNAAVLAGATVFGSRTASRRYAGVSVALGIAGLACALATGLGASPVGVWERGAVYPIFAWQVLTAVVLLRARR